MTRREVCYQLVNRSDYNEGVQLPAIGPSVVYRDKINLDLVCEMISQRSHMTEADVMAILQSFLTNAAIYLMQSHSIRLGDLGYLTSAISTDQVADPTLYTQGNIRKAHVVFVASSKLKAEVRRISFRKQKKQVASVPPKV